jgi:hypothetical protein
MKNKNNSIIAVADLEGDSVSLVGDIYRIIVSGEQTNGAYSLVDADLSKRRSTTTFPCQVPRSILYNRLGDQCNNKGIPQSTEDIMLDYNNGNEDGLT